jgi:signal transduction histidine kinase
MMRSAAWRISLWATLVFAIGTMLVLVFLHRFVADNIQRRTDAWLKGEADVLGDVAERTPKDALHDRVVGEVAELASKEIPDKQETGESFNDMVFFLQTESDGSLKLWVGSGNGTANMRAIQAETMTSLRPTDLHIDGFATPFRVVTTRLDDGSRIYLGLSERDELRVLRHLLLRFFILWLLIVLLGFTIVFFTTHRMLSHVKRITDVAAKIGHSDLDTRVPESGQNDEIGNLALTLNHMLDRIEISIGQLHAITDSLAHDLRSPLTAIRGKLETSLSIISEEERAEPLVSAIEEIDRLTEFLNKSLDVAEAKADALRLTRTEIDLDKLIRVMIDLYDPSMSEKGLKVELRSVGPIQIVADAGLIHRMLSNLFENELMHLPATCQATIQLVAKDQFLSLLLDDDGPGFPPEVILHLFERGIKGRESRGHGLGLAFIEAVVRAHGGHIRATNRENGGASISIELPLIS